MFIQTLSLGWPIEVILIWLLCRCLERLSAVKFGMVYVKDICLTEAELFSSRDLGSKMVKNLVGMVFPLSLRWMM